MARFEVFRIKDSSIIVLDLQSDLLDSLPTRIVVPLYPMTEMPWTMNRLNPRFEIDDATYVMATNRMASIPVGELGTFVCDLSSHSDIIVAATDFLFQGF